MTRRCQHCDGWHFDFDCPKRSKSFPIKSTPNQSPDSDTEDKETLSSASDSSDDAPKLFERLDIFERSMYSQALFSYDTSTSGEILCLADSRKRCRWNRRFLSERGTLSC
jgi:hypothetical protein